MKLAFSTLCAPDWDAPALALRAKEYGYDGVELAGPVPNDVAAVRQAFETGGVEIACLATSISMPPGRRDRAAAAAELRRQIEVAGGLGCRRLRMLDTTIPRGHAGVSAAVEMGRWLLPAADVAAEVGVTIVVENALSFRKAGQVWTMLESISHPNVAACWDALTAVRVGESPAVSVPTLNSRIQYVRLRDPRPGEAAVPVQNLLIRLRGIGYTGWVTVETSAERLAGVVPDLRLWGEVPEVKPKRAVAAK
jgi:sugar phosphate isomerase/epimerase